ncbi:glycosyltransferase family 4 protein [Chloroflexota bacterium]
MKILYVNKIAPRSEGGGEVVLHEVGKRLVKKAHEIYMVCGKTEPHLPDYEEIDGIRIHYVSTIPDFLFRFKKLSFYLSRYLFYFLSVKKIYKVGKHVDIIIDDVAPVPSLAYPISRIQGKPTYAIIHEFLGFEWFRSRDTVTAILGFSAQRLLKVFNFDKIITVSQFTRDRLVKFGLNPEKIFVIPNGIDPSRINHYDEGILPNNSISVLGRLVKLKGHIYLIKAMKIVATEIPGIRLNIIGDGPLRNLLEAKVTEYGLDHNIIFWGRVSDQQKFNILRSSEIFVMPSLLEGFGIVLLEAMACNLPIVANNLLVFREIFLDGKTGYLVDVKNTEEFASKIVELLKDEQQRKEMGKYNREYVKQFSWDRTADMEEKVLLGAK